MLLEDILRKKIEDGLARIAEKIIEESRDELKAQGHVQTGKLRDSLRYELKKLPNVTQAIIWMADYGFSIDGGIKAENIPFSEGSGAGRSDFIEGLQRSWMLRGLSREEALSAAFATAKKQKKEGAPTKDSFKFSSNGKRTGFFSDTVEALEKEIQSLQEEIGNDTQIEIGKFIARQAETFQKIKIF